jgi:PsbP-like protein
MNTLYQKTSSCSVMIIIIVFFPTVIANICSVLVLLKPELAFAQLSGQASIDVTNNTSPPTSPLAPSNQSLGIVGNETMTPTGTNDLIPYSNPNLGFSLEYPSDWQKEETLSFTSPRGGLGNRAPEVISITTEVLPSSDYSLDRYTEAALGQVKSFQDFRLLNSSSTNLGGLPAHMIVYSFSDEENRIPLQNLQAWAVKDGMAYVITYGGTPEEFESSLSALQSVMDSFRFG